MKLTQHGWIDSIAMATATTQHCHGNGINNGFVNSPHQWHRLSMQKHLSKMTINNKWPSTTTTADKMNARPSLRHAIEASAPSSLLP